MPPQIAVFAPCLPWWYPQPRRNRLDSLSQARHPIELERYPEQAHTRESFLLRFHTRHSSIQDIPVIQNKCALAGSECFNILSKLVISQQLTSQGVYTADPVRGTAAIHDVCPKNRCIIYSAPASCVPSNTTNMLTVCKRITRGWYALFLLTAIMSWSQSKMRSRKTQLCPRVCFLQMLHRWGTKRGEPKLQPEHFADIRKQLSLMLLKQVPGMEAGEAAVALQRDLVMRTLCRPVSPASWLSATQFQLTAQAACPLHCCLQLADPAPNFKSPIHVTRYPKI